MRDDAFSVGMQVRFRDIDAMGHVNNAVYATYLEQARAEYYREVLDVSLVAVDTVLVHLSIDYRAPIEFGDGVEIALEVSDLGRSSVTMDYEVYAGGGIAATAESVQVAWDREAGTSMPLPEEWRRAIEAYEGL